MTDPGATTPDGPSTLGRFLSLADAAEVLAITIPETRDLVRSGELPGILVGTHWRIERAVLDGFIEAKYEEARRMALWRQSQMGSLEEYSFDPDHPTRTKRI